MIVKRHCASLAVQIIFIMRRLIWYETNFSKSNKNKKIQIKTKDENNSSKNKVQQGKTKTILKTRLLRLR